MSFNTPILFLIFNRPEETAQSFGVIKQMKPKYLFVAADGPRTSNLDDSEKCESTRRLVLDAIDWDCEIKTLFRTENLGCGKAVQNALDWFFEQVEMGIILEDDIIPTLSFFSYAEILLNRYKDDNTIFSINGCNLAYENNKYDYGLTRYFNMWGWASWRRSNDLVNKTWKTFDSVNDFKKGSSLLKSLQLPTILPQKEWISKWNHLLCSTYNGVIDTWDYQWVYTCLKNNQYCIRPNSAIIKNIGFNINSTHTPTAPHPLLNDVKIDNSKMNTIDFKGKIKIDFKYELVNVAEYWNGTVINWSTLFKKINKKIKYLLFTR